MIKTYPPHLTLIHEYLKYPFVAFEKKIILICDADLSCCITGKTDWMALRLREKETLMQINFEIFEDMSINNALSLTIN